MRYEPSDVTWEVLPLARKVHEDLHANLPEEIALESVRALREHLCAYFSLGPSCTDKAMNVSPMGPARGGKAFKVRWKVPGRGKSGGLRLVVVALCPNPHIVIVHAFARDTDPTDQEFQQALGGLRGE